MEIKYDWLSKDLGIKIEDSEDMVHIKYNNEIKLTYTRPSEDTLRQGVEKVLAEVGKKDLIGKI